MAQRSGDIHGNQFFENATANTGTIINNNYPPPPARPAVCCITYDQNLKIVKRPDITRELEVILAQDHRHAALWGFGGTGKTQLALDYAYQKYRRDGDDACAVFWVHAANETTFAHDYKVIASKLEIGTSLQGEDLYGAVCNRIEEQRSWVMVIDNADDLTIFGQQPTPGREERALGPPRLNLRTFVPKGDNGTVLWTSRDAHITELVGPEQAINVGRMKPEEATLLFAKNLRHAAGRGGRAKPEDAETAAGQQLLKDLEYLPLAISQAGAYIRITRTDILGYLSVLQDLDKRRDVLADGQDDQHRQSANFNSVFRALNVSIEHFQENDPFAYRILSIIAFMDQRNIPEEFVERIVATSESSRDMTDSALTAHATRAVGRLQDFSFFEMIRVPSGATLYEIHKLSQEAIRYHLRMRKNLDGTVQTRMITNFSSMMPKLELDGIEYLSTPREFANFEEIFAVEAYLVWRAVMNHVELYDSDFKPGGLARMLIIHAVVISNNADACQGRGTSATVDTFGTVVVPGMSFGPAMQRTTALLGDGIKDLDTHVSGFYR